MKFIIGKKLVQTRVFDKAGKVIPVTLVSAGPCIVTQVKDKKKDGYKALQLGFDEAKKLAKPQEKALGKLGKFRYLREFRFDNKTDLKVGDKVTVEQFKEGDEVEVSGISKGKGFQGTVKRHGFKGGPASHGHRHVLRKPGSIGGRFPQHTMKGKKMPGRMGGNQVTVKGLNIVKIDPEKNVLAIKGALPGMRKSLVLIKGH